MTSLSPKKKRGAATLLITVMLLVMSTLIIMFAANFGALQNKSTANTIRQYKAFYTANACLEYWMAQLKIQKNTIVASAVNGFVTTPPSNTAYGGGNFSATIRNLIAYDYTLFRVTCVGTNDTATKTFMHDLYQFSFLPSPPSFPLVTKGSVSMSGNATVTNTSSGTTIQSASTVSIADSARTVLSSGTSSTAGNIQSDIQQNSASLSSLSIDDFCSTYFANTITTLKNKASVYYSNSVNTNYSASLNGTAGYLIWIDQTGGTTATIDGSTVMGVIGNPVLLVVNGNLNISGDVTIVGFVFVTGTTTITSTGNLQITGGMGTSGNVTMSGNVSLTYNSSVLQNFKTMWQTYYFVKVPGSWRDF